MEIENLGSGKDFKLWPGGGKSWDWSEHGTSHSGGVRKADVLELIDNGSRVVILTTGMLKRLRVPAATVELLREHGIEVIVASTKKGVQLYNDYVASGAAVGGLFHSTC